MCALMLMLAAMVIGVAVARGASMLRAAAHNERDRDVAHAAAEAGLRDAERDVAGAPGAMPERRAHFGPGGAAAFADSCGRGVDDRGLCRATSPPAWQVLDLAAADHPARRRSRAVFTASRRSDSARAHRRGSYCSPWSGCRSLRQGREVPAAGRGTAVPEGATDMETKADTGAATAMGTKAGNMTTATMGEGARAGAAGIPAAPGTMAARTPATTPDVAQAAPRHLLPSRRRASFPPDGLAGAKSRTGPSCTRAPGRDVARTPPPDRLDRPDRADPLDPPDLRARACRWGGGRRRPGGFTLVELMIVVAIVGILGAFAYPTYAGYIVRTRRTEGQTALIEALQQEERYRLRHNTYVAYSAEEPGTEPFPLWSGVSAATSAYELDAHACPGTGLADCVEVRARPGTAHVDPRFRDPDCGVLTLDSNGRQGAASAGVRCWP